MQHPLSDYQAFTNQRTHYLRKRPYHSTQKICKQLKKTNLRQSICAQWALTLQTLSLAITRCSKQTFAIKKESLDDLEAEDPEKTA